MSYVIEKDWTTVAGLRAVAIISGTGHRCGYVGVAPGHPLHGKDYREEVDALTSYVDAVTAGPAGDRGVVDLFCMSVSGVKHTPAHIFDVHGSLTFSGGNNQYPVVADLWWFGFDCNHLYDNPDTCDLEFVTHNCERLARQIVEMLPMT